MKSLRFQCEHSPRDEWKTRLELLRANLCQGCCQPSMKSPADKQRRSRLLQRRRSLFLEFLEARNLLAGVQAFSGDFNQDGVDTLGLFDPASSEVYLRDENSPGFPQTAFQFPGATATDQALAGNWTGSGRDTVALFNSVDGRVLLANGNSSGATTSFHFTGLPASTLPVAGDWNNTGHDSPRRSQRHL